MRSACVTRVARLLRGRGLAQCGMGRRQRHGTAERQPELLCKSQRHASGGTRTRRARSLSPVHIARRRRVALRATLERDAHTRSKRHAEQHSNKHQAECTDAHTLGSLECAFALANTADADSKTKRH